jgi:hypothetical protein
MAAQGQEGSANQYALDRVVIIRCKAGQLRESTLRHLTSSKDVEGEGCSKQPFAGPPEGTSVPTRAELREEPRRDSLRLDLMVLTHQSHARRGSSQASSLKCGARRENP